MSRRTPSTLRLGLEKTAILGHLLAGPIGHVAVNALGRAAHHGTNLAEVLAHKGLQHGLTGSQISPAAVRSIQALAGPESMTTYHAARALASRVAHLPTDQQHSFFRTALSTKTPALENAPLISPLHKALSHELKGTTPSLASEGAGLGGRLYAKAVNGMSALVNRPFDTGVQRLAKNVAGGAPLAGAAVLDPVGTAAHAGINTMREVAGHSETGKNMMKSMFLKGMRGEKLHPHLETAVDYAVSPAVLDPMRIGQKMRQAAAQLPSGTIAKQVLQPQGGQTPGHMAAMFQRPLQS